MGGGSSKEKGAKGSKQSKAKALKNAVEANWETLENTSDGFNIVRNKHDGRIAEEYHYALDNRHDPAGEALIYSRRSKTTLPIVKSYDHQYATKGKKDIGPNNRFRVVTERIPHRLSQCPQLSFDESLYTLDRSLEGYEYLYNNVGPFDINSNMIGFNTEGEAKVWHNENFGRNYPHHEKRTLQSTLIDDTHRYDSELSALEEVEMVRNLINVIEDRCEQGQFPEPFRSRIRQNVGFEEARRIVNDEIDDTERTRLNRVDLYRNLIKSRVSRLVTTNVHHHSTTGYQHNHLVREETHHSPSNVNFTHNYNTSPNYHTVQSTVLHNPGYTSTSGIGHYETTNQYPVKNAYSFSQNRSTFDGNNTTVNRY